MGRAIILALLLCLLHISSFAQDKIARLSPAIVGGGVATAAYVTDNFDSYDNSSSLDDAANWTVVTGTMTVYKPASDGRVGPMSDAAQSCIRYSGTTFNANQYGQVEFYPDTGSGYSYQGVTLRCSNTLDEYYGLVWSKTESRLSVFYKMSAGSATEIQAWTSKAYTSGNKIRLEVTGSSSSVRLAVKEDTGGGWSTVASNIDPGASHYIDSGWAGIGGYDDCSGSCSATNLMDNWAAGDL